MIRQDCLTEDQLGAILEQRLGRADEAAAWLHISDCDECAAVFNELSEQHGNRTRFGPYKLINLLGRGGMGEVFLARGPSERPVVLKRILGSLLDNPDMLHAFLDETRIAARLRHPNIVRIDELGEVDGEWFVRMEYVEGASLFEVMRRVLEARLSPKLEVVLAIGSALASALDYAHHALDAEGLPLGLVHRDVTPHNVLLSRKGEVKLIDFGVARAEQSLMRTVPGTLKGKLAYMSLEQAQGRVVDGRSDLFALGVCLWEALTTRRLFRGETEAQTLQRVFAGQVPPPSLYRLDVPAEVDALVLKALARKPEDRFSRGAELVEAIDTEVGRLGLPSGAEAIAELMRVLFPQAGQVVGLTSDEEPTAHDTAHSLEREATSPDGPSALAKARSAHGQKIARANDLSAERDAPAQLPDDEHRLIGRAAELADLHQLIGYGSRLITLVGPGGVGKSRLAREVSRQQVSRFRGRVWLADLTGARGIEDVCLSIADALGVALPAAGAPVDSIGHVLASRRECLLVIDHAEVLPLALDLAMTEWLRIAKDASFLVCSQVALGNQSERSYEVTPLPLDSQGQTDSDAMVLFFERATALNPRFPTSRSARELVRKLVRRLEGIPLAIELAAAQMAQAPLESLSAAEDQSMSGGSNGFVPIDAAFDTTWSRLSDEERSALVQCAVFSGGFTADAAINVIRWSPDPSLAHPDQVLKVLHQLRAKSLVRVGFSPKSRLPRYGMYEAIRSRLVSRLPHHEAPARLRHAEHYLALGERLGPEAEKGASVLDVLSVERENLARAWEHWLGRPGDGPKQALRVLLALDAMFVVRGPYGAHLAMLDSVLSKLKTPEERAPALEARARVLFSRGRLADAAADLEELMAQPLEAGPAGRALAYLASVRKQEGALPIATGLYERALTLLEQADDTRMRGRVIANLSAIAQEQGSEHAARLGAEALRLHRLAGDRRFEGVTLTNLAVLQQANGDWEAAEQSCTQAIAVHREVGNRRSEGIAVTNLADLERDREANDLAVVLYRRAIGIHREVGNRRFEGVCLLNQALLMMEQASLPQAAELLDEALGLFQLVGDKRHAALALGARGTLKAMRKDATAVDDFEASKPLLAPTDLGFLSALEVYRAQLQYAEARRLEKTGQVDEAKAWREAAAARVESVTAPSELGSLAQRFEHVRMALRVLRGWLGRSP